MDAKLDAAELLAWLRAIERRQRRLPDVLKTIGAEVLLPAVDDEFRTAGRGTWPPLAPSTLKRRGGSAQPLVDTGRMRSEVAIRSGTNFVEAFSPTPYSVFHTSDGARGRLPRRNFLDVSDETRDDAREVLEREMFGS